MNNNKQLYLKRLSETIDDTHKIVQPDQVNRIAKE